MNRLINRTIRLVFGIVCMTMLFAACSKDEPTSSLKLDAAALFIPAWGGSASVGFTTENISLVKAIRIPEGWTVAVDMATNTIRVTAPAAAGDKISEKGEISFVGYAYEGIGSTAELFVSIKQPQDLTAEGKQANSFIVSTPDAFYQFDAQHKGETTEAVDAHRAELLWQTATELVQYVKLDNGKVGFYVGADADGKLIDGNAVIGVYNAQNEIVWSWHIWITAAAPEKNTVTLGGKTFMGFNLGALKNANATPAEILFSYGLYYQWGRKDPFVEPNTYNAEQGIDAYMYSAEGKKVLLSYVASVSTIGTMEYATKNPRHFILGVADSKYDWLFTAHSNTLWAEAKTVNDPCPKGWRVPSKNDFAGLTIADDLTAPVSQYAQKYGWTLTDGTTSAFFLGAGRRTYMTGKIHNVYNPLPRSEEEAQPWEGLYWTTGSDADTRASAFYFYLNYTDVAHSGVNAAVPYQRANGMQIRCVKI
ncbi:MAG: FISUMP domain-containing protein [Alistipes sp.]